MKDADCGLGEVGNACVRALLVAGATLGFAATAAAAQQTVTPPDAATIERQWVNANRPYDEARKSILAQVQTTAWQGPMQPDWQSLTAYSTPEWYRDAKFGIFIRADAESDGGDLAGDRQNRCLTSSSPMAFIWTCRHSRRVYMPTPIASAWMRVGRKRKQQG